MRVLRCIVAALALVSVASTASAVNSVWYTSGGSGGEGTVLDLTCDTSLGNGTCSYNITMNVDNNAGADTGLIAWASDLHSSAALDNVTGPAIAGGNPFTSASSAGVGGLGAALLTGSQGQTFGAPLAGSTALITFTLNHPFVQGDTSTTQITESAGLGATGVVWATGDGNYAVVSVGGGPAGEHSEGHSGGLAIRITNIPEPTTLGLLAMGGLALIRRRR
jgi:hypothetical protein